MKLSIIIVNYHVKKELFACIQSILVSNPQTAFEVIVIDNDEEKKIRTDLKKKFPQVIYISNTNKGFGQGNNMGAGHAKGEYLFFLNPDTEIYPGTIDNLVQFLQKKKDAAIVAPLLLGTDGKAYQQGTLTLNPLRAIFSLSIFHKLFPNNATARQYFLAGWDRKSVKEVDVAPGTAFMIRKDLFEKLGGFDEKFFLFFEEFDLCKRIKEAGYKIFIYPKAIVVHAWGVSTKQRSDINQIFENSRFYYFRKHFGLFSALLTESILRFSKYTALLIGTLLIGTFLRIHHLEQSMPFIGDQGWYYLSARDMVQTGSIPLVGIASSHPWLHQGALWTYLLAGGFWLFGFSPFVGAWISIFLGMLGVMGMYRLGSEMFSKRVGLIAAALFAVSPLVIVSDRMPYHTSPIPLFTILFIYSLHKWVKGNARYFPAVIFVLGLLYNLEIATVLLGMVTMAVWLYGFLIKKEYARAVLRPKFLVFSCIAFITAMLPMLIYDVGHGFPQTLKFLAWMGYRVMVMFGYPVLHPSIQPSLQEMVRYFFEQVTQLIFPYSGLVAGGIFAFACYQVIKLSSYKVSAKSSSMWLIMVLNVILIVGFIGTRTASGAYLPMMFPGIIIAMAILLDGLMVKKRLKWFAIVGLFIVVILNSYYSFTKNGSDDSFKRRLDVAKQIVTQADGKEYNLKGRGPGSQFESFTMGYEYLAWWLGNGPTKEPQKLQFVVSEERGIRVEKKVGK